MSTFIHRSKWSSRSALPSSGQPNIALCRKYNLLLSGWASRSLPLSQILWLFSYWLALSHCRTVFWESWNIQATRWSHFSSPRKIGFVLMADLVHFIVKRTMEDSLHNFLTLRLATLIIIMCRLLSIRLIDLFILIIATVIFIVVRLGKCPHLLIIINPKIYLLYIVC